MSGRVGKLTDDERAEILEELWLPKKERRTYREIGAQYGVSHIVVCNLKKGRLNCLRGKIGHTDGTLTGPVPHRPAVCPPLVPGVTLAMLTGGRAPVARRRASA